MSRGTGLYYACSRAMKQGKTACKGRRVRMDYLDNIVLGYLSNKLFAPDRLEALLEGYLAKEKDGIAGRREKLRQARDARGGLDAALGRLLALVETGALEPDDATLKDRLVALRMQRTELDRDIERLQASAQTAKVSDAQLAALNIRYNSFHPKWNYSILLSSLALPYTLDAFISSQTLRSMGASPSSMTAA